MKTLILFFVLSIASVFSIAQPITLSCTKPVYHEIFVKSTSENETVVDTITACDQDSYTTITWAIKAGNTNYSAFSLKSISPLKAQLLVANKRALTKYRNFSLKIRGTDNGKPALYNEHIFTITVSP